MVDFAVVAVADVVVAGVIVFVVAGVVVVIVVGARNNNNTIKEFKCTHKKETTKHKCQENDRATLK